MRNATLCFPRALLSRAIDGGPIRPSSGRQFLIPGHDDAVVADLLVERTARNAKRFRRAADPSARGLERLADQVLLRLEETAISSSRRRGGRGREGKVLRPDLRPVRQENGALERVAQLADVTRPAMSVKLLESRGGKPHRSAIELERDLPEEQFRERGQIVGPLPKRRN